MRRIYSRGGGVRALDSESTGAHDGGSFGFDMQWMDRGADVAAAAIPARIGARLNMDTQRWERIGDVFERLLGVSQVQRPHLLDSLCGEDAEMKRIVASMLESEDSAQRSD